MTTHASRHVSRRHVAAASAWVVPAIVVGSPAAATAASDTQPPQLRFGGRVRNSVSYNEYDFSFGVASSQVDTSKPVTVELTVDVTLYDGTAGDPRYWDFSPAQSDVAGYGLTSTLSAPNRLLLTLGAEATGQLDDHGSYSTPNFGAYYRYTMPNWDYGTHHGAPYLYPITGLWVLTFTARDGCTYQASANMAWNLQAPGTGTCPSDGATSGQYVCGAGDEPVGGSTAVANKVSCP